VIINKNGVRTEIFLGDCRESMKSIPERAVNCCVTSPPYFGLRDYGVIGQIGAEDSPEEFISTLVDVFRSVHRVLRDDGTLWLNLGDSYGKEKQLIGAPWRVALALQDDGWILRQDIIWHKPNAMPESVKDRCVKAHEYLFLFSKTEKYNFDYEAVKEDLAPGSDVAYRNKLRKNKTYNQKEAYKNNFPASFDENKRRRRSVWSINTKPYTGAHCAPFPAALVDPCVLAGCPLGGVVLDPFGGSGTVAGVSMARGRNSIMLELNKDFADLIPSRIDGIIADSYFQNKLI
jgi:DNA modification methylase